MLLGTGIWGQEIKLDLKSNFGCLVNSVEYWFPTAASWLHSHCWYVVWILIDRNSPPIQITHFYQRQSTSASWVYRMGHYASTMNSHTRIQSGKQKQTRFDNIELKYRVLITNNAVFYLCRQTMLHFHPAPPHLLKCSFHMAYWMFCHIADWDFPVTWLVEMSLSHSFLRFSFYTSYVNVNEFGCWVKDTVIVNNKVSVCKHQVRSEWNKGIFTLCLFRKVDYGKKVLLQSSLTLDILFLTESIATRIRGKLLFCYCRATSKGIYWCYFSTPDDENNKSITEIMDIFHAC